MTPTTVSETRDLSSYMFDKRSSHFYITKIFYIQWHLPTKHLEGFTNSYQLPHRKLRLSTTILQTEIQRRKLMEQSTEKLHYSEAGFVLLY